MMDMKNIFNFEKVNGLTMMVMQDEENQRAVYICNCYVNTYGAFSSLDELIEVLSSNHINFNLLPCEIQNQLKDLIA